jgi:hypothetical protein
MFLNKCAKICFQITVYAVKSFISFLHADSKNGKAGPLQAWSGPEGSSKIR